MAYPVGSTMLLPDGRVGVVLARERVQYAGRIVNQYALAFDASSVVNECEYATIIPEASVINNARLQ